MTLPETTPVWVRLKNGAKAHFDFTDDGEPKTITTDEDLRAFVMEQVPDAQAILIRIK
jgi:hypothetical protein